MYESYTIFDNCSSGGWRVRGAPIEAEKAP